MATYSSIFAWRITWTKETGGLQSMGSQRAGHGWSDLAHMHISVCYIKTYSHCRKTEKDAIKIE